MTAKERRLVEAYASGTMTIAEIARKLPTKSGKPKQRNATAYWLLSRVRAYYQAIIKSL